MPSFYSKNWWNKNRESCKGGKLNSETKGKSDIVTASTFHEDFEK